MVSVLRPGQRILNIPGYGVQTSRRAVASGAAAWWLAGGAPTPVAVWQPIRAASLAASYLRVAGSGGYANIDPTVVGGVAPTFNTATGWTGNGSSMYLRTGFTPAADWSALVAYSNANAGGNALGARNTSRMEIRPDTGSNQVQYGNGGVITVTPKLSTGILAVAGLVGYRNGVQDTTSIPAWTGAANEIYLLGTDFGGGVLGYFSGSVQAVAFWDTSTGHATWMPAVMAACALI